MNPYGLTEIRWSPYIVGCAIGVLSWFTLLVSRHTLGCSTSFARSAGMIERLFRGRKVEQKAYYREYKPVVDWQWMPSLNTGSVYSKPVNPR